MKRTWTVIVRNLRSDFMSHTRKLAILFTVAILAGCACPNRHAFHIDHIDDPGAFRGIVDGSYYREGDTLKIDVDKWVVRFGVGDQPGRQLAALCFELGIQSPGGYWSQGIKSDRLVMNQYVNAGKDLVLKDLEFCIDIEPNIWTQKTWIVAEYENGTPGSTGMNIGLDQYYLFSTQQVALRKTGQ